MVAALTDEQIDWTRKFTGVDPSGGGRQAAPADAPGGGPRGQPDPALAAPQHAAHADQELFRKTKNADGTETDTVTDDEIRQGRLGDCYLLASLGEVARINPDVIRKMIKDNKDGTYTVTLHRRKGGAGRFIAGLFGGAPEFEEVQETVDGDFPTGTGDNKGSANQYDGEDADAATHKKVIWVEVVEKAYAKLMGGYAEIGKGASATKAMEALTGQEATEKQGTFSGVSQNELIKAFNDGKPVTLSTPDKKTLPFQLVGDHVYMLENVVVKDGKATLQVRNPWGDKPGERPDPVPFDKLKDGFSGVEIGGKLPPRPPAQAGKSP